jgi:gamma-glutamyltranspeptidase/glutathione hydrolase
MKLLCLLAILLGPVTPALSQQVADGVAPEAAVENSFAMDGIGSAAQFGYQKRVLGEPVVGKNWMISVANPIAAEAGAKILAQGGTAADAMVAAQAMLGLVEPQSSGIGGGGFLVWYDAEKGQVTTLDGRETAPLAMTPTVFQDAQGKTLAFFDAVVGVRSVGTPSMPKLMAEAHARWGRLAWSRLFQDAIARATDGFHVSPRLAGLVAKDVDRLARFDATRKYFMPEGTPIGAGDLLKNPDYAETLRALSKDMGHSFYYGAQASEIVDTLKRIDPNAALLSLVDMAIYEVKERDAVCAPYRGYDVCGMGPPSSGGIAVGQILGLLEGFNLAEKSADDPQTWRLIGDASRLAFADRGRYVADMDFVPVPIRGLLDPAYLRQRSELMKTTHALAGVAAGKPEFDHAFNYVTDYSDGLPSTTHISIVDQYGNALSMTSSIENAFGSRVMVGGFLLNNQLTDFSFSSHQEGRALANAAAPTKRPRSSMAPTIVMKEGKPVLIIGSPGGSRIIGYVAKTIIAFVDWGMNIQEAIEVPHLINRFGAYDIEAGTGAEALEMKLQNLGYKTRVTNLTSGLQGIAIGEALMGGADPRREGVAISD